MASAEGRAITRIAAEYTNDASASGENFWHRRSQVLEEIFQRHLTGEDLAAGAADVPFIYQMLIAPIHVRILLNRELVDDDFLAKVTATVLSNYVIRR